MNTHETRPVLTQKSEGEKMENNNTQKTGIREIINLKANKKCSKCRVEIPENAKAYRRITSYGTFAPGLYCSQKCAQYTQ